MTDWQPPRELPDLRRVGRISLDSETHDVGLQEGRGSSWPWRAGHLCGISIAHRREAGIVPAYFPINHPDTECFDRDNVARWLNDHKAVGVKFVGMNSIYDWGSIGAYLGVAMPPADQLDEVGALAVTLDENCRAYSLDAIAGRCGLPGKDDALLREAVMTAGLAPKRRRKKAFDCRPYIWQLPARFVAPYAEADAVQTLECFEILDPQLDLEGTREAYRHDVDLIPMVLAMIARGIRIDEGAAVQARDYCLAKRNAALAELSAQHGSLIGMDEINSPIWKAKTFARYGIVSPSLTPTGKPSFAAGKTGWMSKHEHWLPGGIAIAGKYHAAGSKFLESYILAHVVNGRIHAEIHPFRAEEGGARSSRFSYSNPPLQQMPIRDKELGPLIRGAFLPEEDERWAKPDLSQQEFRGVVHYAVQLDLRGAREAAEVYRNNPDADFHTMVAEMTGLPRDAAKAVNFAKIYGAGTKKLAEMIGKPLAEVQAIVAQYDRKLPFVSRLSRICQEKAARIGFTVLYDGARRHWNLYEVPWLFVKGAGPCDLEEARRRVADPEHPWYCQRLSRANTYTALNALIQGTSARHTKLWMRACWREGITPLLQMHDCLDCSVSTREQAELVARLGCDAVSLEVPMRVDLKFGKSWGDAVHAWEDQKTAPGRAAGELKEECDENV